MLQHEYVFCVLKYFAPLGILGIAYDWMGYVPELYSLEITLGFFPDATSKKSGHSVIYHHRINHLSISQILFCSYKQGAICIETVLGRCR